MDKPAVRITADALEYRVGEQLEDSNRLPGFNQVLHQLISFFIVPPSSPFVTTLKTMVGCAPPPGLHYVIQ
jgi:hypothetical protein